MWRIIFVLTGLMLVACQPSEPVLVTRVEMTTAVPSPTSTATPIPIIETLSPTSLPTRVYTPTPIPTITAVPTDTPIPILPPILPAKPDQLPLISFDLLFMDGDTLKLWAHESGQIATLLAGPLRLQYSLDAEGKTILVARELTADPATAELVLIERATGQSRVLLGPITGLADFALSPDGQSVVYTVQDEDQPTGSVHFLTSDGATQTIATCQWLYIKDHPDWVYTYDTGCGDISWAPDNQTFLWNDIDGVWAGGLQTPPRLLIANEWFDDDPPRTYYPTQDWSPNGRYLLIQARRGGGITLRILDTNTEAVIEVPYFLSTIDPEAYWLWTQDNRLFVMRPHRRDETPDNFAEIWRVAETELIQEDALAIPRLASEVPAPPAQLDDSRFAFVLTDINQDSGQARGLYFLDDLDTSPQKVNSLPPARFIYSLVWLPDGQAAIYHYFEGNQILFVPTDGSPLIDLTEVMGKEMSNLAWLP